VSEPLRILVAEDDPSDALLLERAFSKVSVNVPIHFVRDGQEVIDYLQGVAPFDNREIYPLPKLLVLDLSMPRLNGFEVLMWLRRNSLSLEGDSHLARRLVVILTASSLAEDINRAYALGANSYLIKPQDPGGLERIATGLENYWVKLNIPPD